MSDFRRRLMMRRMSGGLPAGYTQLEYVSSNNNAKGYIDTGVVPEKTDYIEIDVFRRTDYAPWGSDNFVIAISGSEYWRVFNNLGVDMNSSHLKAWQQYIYKDGYLSEPKQFGRKTLSASDTKCFEPLYLFRRFSSINCADSDIAYCRIEKIYGYVKELIPAVRNDGMVGMYDIANGYFHVPPSGYLIAGPAV